MIAWLSKGVRIRKFDRGLFKRNDRKVQQR